MVHEPSFRDLSWDGNKTGVHEVRAQWPRLCSSWRRGIRVNLPRRVTGHWRSCGERRSKTEQFCAIPLLTDRRERATSACREIAAPDVLCSGLSGVYSACTVEYTNRGSHYLGPSSICHFSHKLQKLYIKQDRLCTHNETLRARPRNLCCSGKLVSIRVQLKRDGTRWRTEGEVKGRLTNGVGSQYSSLSRNLVYPTITTADAHSSAVSSQLNWRPCRFKWTRPFRRKTKSGFCACAITFQTHCTYSECV